MELISRIPNLEPELVYDLGCGSGELTSVLAERWPEARVVGIDSSPEMLRRAECSPGIGLQLGDITTWQPDSAVDLIYSNAALHWLDDHATLFPRLASLLTERGVLAVQMPDNWNAPTHRIPADVLDQGDWPESARRALMRDRLSSPGDYADWVGTDHIDLWTTTYYHRLTGADPVWEWVTGSVLRPVLAELDDEGRTRFAEECKGRYREAYPPSIKGVTTLAFSRLFLVGQAG